jgi:Holliday junction resolvase
MSGGRSPRQKGNRVERFLVNLLQERGFAAERIPLSGAAGGSFKGDVTVALLGVDRTAEVKARKHGFQQLYQWLDGNDLLIVKQDRAEPIVIIKLTLAVEIAAAAERNKPQ